MKTKIERMKELVKQLNIYRDSYYNRQESLVSDREYDELFDELEALETETNTVMANSPTQTVGFEVKSKLEKVKHSHPMLSLGKTKDFNDLIKFAGDKDCILSLKMDGLTVLLGYDNGELVSAETRGDGETGENIFHNAKVFENIPLTIPYKGHFEIEGEAIIDYDDFNRINASLPEGTEPYKTPRNLVSGSVRQLDSKIAKDRHIKFIAWKVPTECGENLNSFANRLNYAKGLGFEIVPFCCFSKQSYDSGILHDKVIEGDGCKTFLHYTVEQMQSVAKKKEYPIDGLVMTYNDITYGKSLGLTSHHPKHSIAYKFYDEYYTTKFIGIDWTMGKSGTLTPIAMFNPVEIDGTMVERASLHNVSIADSFKLRPGDEIEVFKANMIVPQVKCNLDAEGREDYVLPIPYTCPICGGPTQLVTNGNTTTLECTNPNCKGKLLGRLTHFCSKEAMNIEGLSESTLSKFIELGWLERFIDIYRLYEHGNEMKTMAGFGKKSVDKLLESIEKSKHTTLDRFIYALSIPLIGRSASKTISKYCNGRFEEFMIALENNFDFTKLDDFGEAMNRSIKNYFDPDKYYEILTLAGLMTFEEPEKQENNSLEGKTFVITGSVHNFKNRNELKAKIESMGGKVAGSVSKNTDFLINNDTESASSKNKKAKELGVKIISEAEFMEMIK